MSKHYMVTSPTMTRWDEGGIEPPEDFYGCCIVTAPNRREAERIAIKHKDMRDWVDESRSNGQNPFAGLRAQVLTDEEVTELQ